MNQGKTVGKLCMSCRRANSDIQTFEAHISKISKKFHLPEISTEVIWKPLNLIKGKELEKLKKREEIKVIQCWESYHCYLDNCLSK